MWSDVSVAVFVLFLFLNPSCLTSSCDVIKLRHFPCAFLLFWPVALARQTRQEKRANDWLLSVLEVRNEYKSTSVCAKRPTRGNCFLAHTIDRLEEGATERGSARRSSSKGRKIAIVNQTNIGTVSRATLGKLLREGVERI